TNFNRALFILEQVENSIEEARTLLKQVLESEDKNEKIQKAYSILTDILILPPDMQNDSE
ncbi:unnamed protein product, partial [marine sediment metagenome]